MIKFIIILIIGTFETYVYTKWNLRANKNRPINSSIMMMMYMAVYLWILDLIFKDINSKIMMISYVIACGIGNYLAVRHENRKKL
jgi:ABC-type Fe3+ transport system permease subunit